MKKNMFLLMTLLIFSVQGISQVNTEKYRTAADSLGFSGTTAFDFTLMSGSTDFQYMGTNLHLNYQFTSQQLLLIAGGGFGRKNGSNFFKKSLVHLRDVIDITERIQFESFAQYDNNPIRLLSNRSIAGGGFRFIIPDLKSLRTRLGISAFYEHEEYSVEQGMSHDQETKFSRLSTYLTWSLNPAKSVSLQGVSYYQPRIESPSDHRILSENSLQVNLNDKVKLVTKLNIFFDSHPADGVDQMELISTTGIALKID